MSIRMDERTSGTLVEAVKNLQDCTSWNQFVLIYGPMFHSWLRRYGLSQEANEDVISQVFGKLVVNLPKFVYDPQMSFRGWLHRIVDNAARDSLRKNSRQEKLHRELAELDDSPSFEFAQVTDTASIDQITECLEQRLRIAQAVVSDVRGRVAATTWDAFYLKVVEDWTAESVATHLGIAVKNVYVYVFRIRKMLDESRSKLATEFQQL